MDDKRAILKKYFGFDSFRDGQEEIIDSILNDRDVLAVMPTGGGKSLCYQLPAIMKKGTALIISPLIALMKDQVDSLKQKNIPAEFINSTLGMGEIQARLDGAIAGDYKLLYIAPERLESKRFLNMLSMLNISFVAVDEAHCVSQWGHDFRPSYLYISKAVKSIRYGSLAALTATATPEVRDDIVQSLEMKLPNEVIKGFDRPNLKYISKHSNDKISDLQDIFSNMKSGSGIVYCGTRKKVEEYTAALKSKRINAEGYHAGMKPIVRKKIQEDFITGRKKIILATNAFGMGIDKADVRTVVHVDLPQTVEAYYQEAGRAGRDGEKSECIMLYHPSDIFLQEFFIDANYPPKEDIRKVYTSIYDMAGAGNGEKPAAPLYADEIEIAERARVNVSETRSIIGLLERFGILLRSQALKSARLKITTSRNRLVDYMNNTNEQRAKVLESILRSSTSESMEKFVDFDLKGFLLKYDLSTEEFRKAVEAFEFARLLKFTYSGSEKGILLKKERAPILKIPIDFSELEERRDHAVAKADIMRMYAETAECKRNFILQYFGESNIQDSCGNCSSCLSGSGRKKRKPIANSKLQTKVLTAVCELDGRFNFTILTDYLHGDTNKQIKDYGLDKPSGFGSASDSRLIRIKEEIDKAIYARLIEVKDNNKNKPKITKEGRLKLGRPVNPLKLEFKNRKVDNALYEELCQLREELAAKDGIVPRAIASDRAVKLISKNKPVDDKGLSEIQGIGPIFKTRYGRFFISRVQEYLNPKHKIKLKPVGEEIKKAAELWNTFTDFEHVASKMKISTGEASFHIQKAIEAGLKLDVSDYKDSSVIEIIIDVLMNRPNANIAEIRRNIPVNINIETLRINIALAKNELGIR